VADYYLAHHPIIRSLPQVLDGRAGTAHLRAGFDPVASNLTLNLGLRWEYSTPWYDTQNKIVALVPGLQSTQYPNAPTGLVYPGDPGIPKTLAPPNTITSPSTRYCVLPNVSEGFLGKILADRVKPVFEWVRGFSTPPSNQTLYWILGTVPFGEYWGSPAPRCSKSLQNQGYGSLRGNRSRTSFRRPEAPRPKNFDYSPYLPLVSTLGTTPVISSLMASITTSRSSGSSAGRWSSVSVTWELWGQVALHQPKPMEGIPSSVEPAGSGVMPGTQECGRFLEDQTFTRPDGTQVFGTRSPFGHKFGLLHEELGNSYYNSLQASLSGRRHSSFLFGTRGQSRWTTVHSLTTA